LEVVAETGCAEDICKRFERPFVNGRHWMVCRVADQSIVDSL
jgi:hypothetical protein